MRVLYGIPEVIVVLKEYLMNGWVFGLSCIFLLVGMLAVTFHN